MYYALFLADSLAADIVFGEVAHLVLILSGHFNLFSKL